MHLGSTGRRFLYGRKNLKKEGVNFVGFIPQSTAPKTKRKSNISPKIIEFIRNIRERYPRLGKEKIKPLLDEYCESEGLEKISVSTIGNIIKRNNFFYQPSGRIYHNPQSKWARRRGGKKKRIRRAPKYNEPGHIQADTIEIVVDGIKYYFYSAKLRGP